MNELKQLSTSIVVEWAYGVLTSDYAYFLLEPQAIQALVDKIAKSPNVFKYRYVFLLPNEKQQLVEMVSQSPRLSKRLYTECKSYLTPQQQQLLLDAVLSDAVCSRQLYPQVTDQALRQQLLASVMRDTQESLLLFQDINDSQLRDTLFPVIAPTESLAALLTSNLERKHFDMLLNWVLSDWDQSFQLWVRYRHILNSEDSARVREKVLSDRAKLLASFNPAFPFYHA